MQHLIGMVGALGELAHPTVGRSGMIVRNDKSGRVAQGYRNLEQFLCLRQQVGEAPLRL